MGYREHDMSEMQPTWNYTNTYDYDRVGRMPPLMICVACNGGVQGKEYSDALPESADEIADSVQKAYEAGASMVHVHARDPRMSRAEQVASRLGSR